MPLKLSTGGFLRLGTGGGLGLTTDLAAILPANTVAPTISGNDLEGSTLTATTGTWTNGPTSYAYQWLRAGAPIAGATASTYDTTASDVGLAVTVSVAGVNAAGTSSYIASSNSITPIPLPTGDVTTTFGALTAAGAGGVAVTGTSISSGDASGHWQISGGYLSPSATGDSADLSGGPYSLTLNDSQTVSISIAASTYTVRTDAELATVIAFSDATLAGKTIELRSGDFARWNMTSRAPSSDLTIQSADTPQARIYGNTASNTMTLTSCQNIVFNDLNFYYDPPALADINHYFAWVGSCTNVDFTSCVFETSGASGFGTTADGKGTGTSLYVRDGNGCTVDSCTFDLWAVGAACDADSTTDAARVYFTNNTLTQFRQDGLKAGFGLQATGNSIINHLPAPGLGDHADGIQISNSGDPNPPSKHVLIRRNYIMQGQYGRMQGVFFGNEDQGGGAGEQYNDFTIDHNVIAATDLHGVNVIYCDTVDVSRNTILERGDRGEELEFDWTNLAVTGVPRIYATGANITGTNNITPSVGSGFTAGSQTVARYPLMRTTYLNPFNVAYGPDDFLYLPSTGYGSTIGSDLLVLDSTPASLTARIRGLPHNGGWDFDAQYSADASGYMTGRATFAWASDTGWSDTGEQVSKVFAAGTHVVTLTVTRTSDSATAQRTMTVVVPSSWVEVQVEVVGGSIVDTGPHANSLTTNLTATVSNDATRGDVIAVNTSKRVWLTASRARNNFNGLHEWTASMWVKLTAAGQLISMYQSLLCSVQAGGALRMAVGSDTLTGSASAALNDAWHKLHFVFDGPGAKMRAYVDGTASLDTACVTTYLPIVAQNLSIGDYDFANGATGLIDEIKLMPGIAMTAAAIAADQS